MTRGEFMAVWQGWLADRKYHFSDKRREWLWRCVQDLGADVFERETERLVGGLDENYGGRPSLSIIASQTRRTEDEEKPRRPEPEVERDPAFTAAMSAYTTALLSPDATPADKAAAIKTWMDWRNANGHAADPAERQKMGALWRQCRDAAKAEQETSNGG